MDFQSIILSHVIPKGEPMMLRRRNAVSPAISNTILVAVAIMVSVGVSYWLVGVSTQSTMFETIEITTAYNILETNVTNAHWKIVLGVKNTGSEASTIREIFVNGVPVNDYRVSNGGSLSDASSTGTSIPSDGLTLMSGEGAIMYVWIGSDLMSSGTSCEVKIHSVAGMDYMRLIKLI
jgi:hypothetical protein